MERHRHDAVTLLPEGHPAGCGEVELVGDHEREGELPPAAGALPEGFAAIRLEEEDERPILRPGHSIEDRRDSGPKPSHAVGLRQKSTHVHGSAPGRPAGQLERRPQHGLVGVGKERADDGEIGEWQKRRRREMNTRPGDPRGMPEESGDGGPASPLRKRGRPVSGPCRVGEEPVRQIDAEIAVGGDGGGGGSAGRGVDQFPDPARKRHFCFRRFATERRRQRHLDVVERRAIGWIGPAVDGPPEEIEIPVEDPCQVGRREIVAGA